MAGYRIPGYLPNHHVILTENSELLRTTLADGIETVARKLHGCFVVSDYQMENILKTAAKQPEDGVSELIKILKGRPVVHFESFIECLNDLGYLGFVQKLCENTIPQIETRPSPSTSSSIDTGSALSLQTVTQPSSSTSTDTGSALVSQTETLHEIRVSIIGKTGVGKSALGNALLQHDTFKSQQKTTSVTSECGSGQRILQLNGVDILLKVVDTPGLFDTGNSNKTIAKEIVKCINLLSPGPHLFLLVFRIDSRLSQEDIKVLEYFKNTFGEMIDKFAVVVFTGKDQLDRSEEKAKREFGSQLSIFSDVFKNRRFATINNKDTTEGKTEDVERILKLLQTTIHNNGGDFYKNEMYEEAKKLFETKIQDQEVINQNRLAKLTKQIEHFKQREREQKQREEQLNQRENNLRSRELTLKRKEDGLSYTEQVTTSAYQYVEYLESPPHAKSRKIIPRREKGMMSPKDNNTVIPHHTDQTYGEISDSSQGNHLMIREMCDRRHYDVSHSGVGNRSEIYNGEIDVVKVKIKKAHSTLILAKKKPDYQNVQIKEETLSTCRRNVKNIANCVLYENQESVFSHELEDEHEEDDPVKTTELNTSPASQAELDAGIQTTDDSPRDITVDMIDDQKAGKNDVVSPLVIKQEPQDDVVDPLVIKQEPQDETYGEPTLLPQDIVYNDDQDNTTLLTPGHHSPNLETCLESTSQHQDLESGQPSTSSSLNSSHINQRKDDTTPVKTSPVYDDDEVVRPVDKYTLFKVCEHGTLDELKSILSDKTIDINSTDYYSYRRTAMYDCIISGIQPVEKMRVLISSGANLDVKDWYGNNLLHEACQYGRVETVELLLNTGRVDIESKDNNGNTPILVAIRSYKQPVEKMRVLANFGANLNVKDWRGNSLLHVACKYECVETVEWLLNTGRVDIESKDNNGNTPILVAIRSHKQPVEKVKLLSNFGANLNVKFSNHNARHWCSSRFNYSGGSLLHYICRYHKVEDVEFLLSKNVDIEIRNTAKETPIISALRSATQPGQKVELLLDKFAQLGHSATVLQNACQYGSLGDVKYFIDKGFNVETRNDKNESPLMLAVCSTIDTLPKVKILLDAGAKLDSSTRILHYACQYGNLDCVKYFIDKGFNVETRNDKNESPLVLAVCSTIDTLPKVKMLLDAGAKLDNILHYACQYGSLDSVKYFIDKGFNMEARNDKNESLLTLAICSTIQSLPKVKVVLNAGAKLDSTPNILNYACQYGSLECVKYFIKKKLFNIESRDDNNRTPLFYCILTERKNFINKIDLLMSMNVNKMVRDMNNLSVLQFARQHARKTRVQYLIEKSFTD